MNNYKPHFLILILVVIMIFGACSGNCNTPIPQEATVPPDMVDHYTHYLEAAKSDWYTAVNDYCHYEMQDRKAMAEISKMYIQEYEISTWAKITDQLWVVNATLIDVAHPEGVEVTNFVGVIDDQYYVMTGVDQVPLSLKGNADIETYRPIGDDIISPEDILGPIG